MRRWPSSEQIWQDVRYAIRRLRRAPGFTTIAILSLVLGIGANTAIFSLMDTLMLRMLPVSEPRQLVEFLTQYPGEPRGNWFSVESFEKFRDANRTLSGLTGSTAPSSFSLRVDGSVESERVTGEYVAGNFFQLLGLKPAIGRLINPEDDRDPAVAVMSFAYWRSKFNLDQSILGKRIVVEGVELTVVGVAPCDFFGLVAGSRTDIWVAMPTEKGLSLRLLGRLKPNVSLLQARSEMTVLYRATVEERARGNPDPLIRQSTIAVEPAGAGFAVLRDQFAKPLQMLMVMVGLLLLIACANVALMLLAQGAVRQREWATRVSLGASRIRIVCQMVTESLLLSAAGCLPGVVLAYFSAGALVRILTSGRPIIGLPPHLQIQMRPDVRVLLFTAGIAVLTGVLFGLAPAWEVVRTGETRSRKHFGGVLVSAEVALSVVLLTAGGLFVSYLWNLRNLNLGFQRDHVLLVSLVPSGSSGDAARSSRDYQELISRLEAIPGVRSATLSGTTPISGAGASGFAQVEGFEERPEDRRYVAVNLVAPKYFETLGTPLLKGRDFDREDTLGRPPIAIINQAMARYYFGERDPLGRHVTLDHLTGGGGGQPVEIVGVVGDAKYLELHGPAPRTLYLSAFQAVRVPSQFALRTTVDPAALTEEVRRTAHDLLPTVPVRRITTLEDQVDASIVPERLLAGVAGLFGGLGAVLAAIGIYGLMAYTVARRVHEIGIRMALGATRGLVTRMVLSDAFKMVAVGLAIGAPVAFWTQSLAASFIQDLPASSGRNIVFGAGAMVSIALLAAYVPAYRAAHVEPMQALRHESSSTR